MKLFYYKSPEVNNFGDDLNEWLWERIIPGFLDDDEQVLFVGIGTLLNDYLPQDGQKVVFGSGVGYGNGLPIIKNWNDWQFYCVRGPLSAIRLGLPLEKAVTDSAVLMRTIYQVDSRQKQYKFSYMPHAYFAWRAGNSWREICEDLGFGFIDARQPVEDVLEAMLQTEVLLTEAMHGAIIADALRIPWIPVRSCTVIPPFKWLDWSLSLGMDYKPSHVTLPWDPDSILKIPLNRMRRILARHELQYAAKHTKPQLSNNKLIQEKTEQLLECLDRLKQDFIYTNRGLIELK